MGYGTFLAFVVFWPSPIDQPVEGLLDRAISEMHERGVPAAVDYSFIEFTANIGLFIPVGVLFGLLFPLRWSALALLGGPVLSVLIELAQRQLLEARYATLGDVIANSIGATIGVLLTMILRAVVAARDEKVIARYRAIAAQSASRL
nr:VanZ family protein [Microbacterium hominis]